MGIFQNKKVLKLHQFLSSILVSDREKTLIFEGDGRENMVDKRFCWWIFVGNPAAYKS